MQIPLLISVELTEYEEAALRSYLRKDKVSKADLIQFCQDAVADKIAEISAQFMSDSVTDMFFPKGAQ